MIPKECKRLAEVDFPIAAVSKHSTKEKSIRHGHVYPVECNVYSTGARPV
jgi:adenine-specific DNA methylase